MIIHSQWRRRGRTRSLAGYNEAFTKRPEGGHTVQPFSTSIAAAWEVVEKLQQDGLSIEVLHMDIGYGARFVRTTSREILAAPSPVRDAPHAICLAALSAMGIAISPPKPV